jgi:MFS superfamily sulfate permease-like transporter
MVWRHSQPHMAEVGRLAGSEHFRSVSRLQALQELNKALTDQGKRLYLAKIKGPVTDRLQTGHVAADFDGRLFLSAQQAWDALSSRPG